MEFRADVRSAIWAPTGRDRTVGTVLAVSEHHEGREAVMAGSGLIVDLAECEFLCSMPLGRWSYGS